MNFAIKAPFVMIFSYSVLFGMEGQKTGYPKWDGLLDLQAAGLRTPKAVFIRPFSEKSAIADITNSFLKTSEANIIGLRPDGVNGIGKTPPGNSFKRTEINNIIQKSLEWSSYGYGVTLIEAHNRFDYDFCCNVLLLDEEGNFIIEFVGPGFDGGDLNKSLLKPSISIKNKCGSPIFIYSDPVSGEASTETLDRLSCRIDIDVRTPTDEEITSRLTYIMERLLPDMGIQIDKSLHATQQWLEENKCARLLEKKAAGHFLALSDLRNIVLAASRYANFLTLAGRKIGCHALTAHKFDGQIIFFGTHNGQKWGKS